MRARNLALLLLVLLAFGWQAWQKRAGEGAAAGASTAPPASLPMPDTTPDRTRDTASASDAAGLPREATQVLASIRACGPYRYERDGVVFGNFEGRLPARPRGYYHEYTVPTPGERSRGARRIIAGGTPPREFWYTADHYESFVRVDDGAGAAR